MKKVKLFFSILLVLSILTSANIFAQSESSDVIGISPGDTQVTEPMIAVNPIDPNNFITVYSKWVDELRRPASSSTTDGGITWSSTEVPENLYRYPVPLSERPDPTVAFDADGYAHFCYMDEQRQTPYLGFRRDLVVAHSTNKGATWHDTSVVYDYLRYTTQYRVDKPWITADCNSYSTYKNSQYIAFTSIYNWGSGNEQYSIQFSYKRPGEYYCKPFKISPVVGGSQKVFGAFPVVGLDGTIYVFWGLQTYSQESQTTSSSIQMVKLTNGGQNFSSPVTIKTGIAESEFQISFQKAHSWPYVVVNPLDGSLNMVYGNGTKLYFSFSTNKGVTWSTSSNKGMSTSTSAWNPNITCNSKGKLAVVYYTSGYKVIVATGYATDESFEIFDQGSSNFSNPYKFTDYIGIACNDYTYWGVWPAPYQPTSKSKIFGRHRTIGALVENLNQDHLQFDNSKLYFDGGTAKTSPYSTATNLFPGKTHTLKIYSPTIIKNGSTYNFYQWEDENGLLLSTNAEISVPIDNHKYRAMFNYQAPPPPQSVTVYIKNEFKDPDNTIRNGGTVNVDEEDVLNTEDLPGQQVTKTYLQGDHHRFEAKEQIYPAESFYRGFNIYSQYDGGWVFPNQTTRVYQNVINPLITTTGYYTAKYRNQYNVQVNGNAPESNSFISNISPTKQIWQYESEYIFAPLTQPFSSGLTGTFTYWSDGENLNPRQISLNNNLTYNAIYKYSNRSNLENAYSNNSQRKFLRTTYETAQLNSVYESLNRVWYEASTDGGSTWSIKNNGTPLSPVYSTSPSISTVVWPDNAWVLISFAESYDNSTLTSDIRVMRIIPSTSQLVQQLTITDGYSDGLFKNPVIASNASQSTNTHFVLVYELKTYDNFNDWAPGIYYLVGYVPVNGFYFEWLGSPTLIPGTNASSFTPAISTNYNHYTNTCEYTIVWEQRTSSNSSKIQSRTLSVSNLNSWSTTLSPTTINISDDCGFVKNYAPSLITMNNNVVKAVWQGARQVTADESPTGPQGINALTNWEYKTVYKDLTTGSKKIYGTKTNLPTINKLDNNSEFFFAYSEQNDLAGKVVLGSDLRTINQLDAFGKDVQISNGSNLNNVRANLFKSTSLPFYFSLSTNLEHVTPKKNNLTILSGREGVVFKDSAQFYFAVGDVLVDNQPVEFKALSDTIQINTKELVNSYLETETFTLSDNSVFYYSVQYGVTDSLVASQVLTDSRNINFKVELLEASSGAIIGSFDNVFYSQDSIYLYNNIAYQVNTAGIGNTQVKLRLVINSSGDFDYSLSERFAEGSVLGKMAFKQINIDGSGLIKEYDLAQNYPNPFNPSTTIRYQIPQDGIVTLKIYDILGSEVATLVNEQKVAGRYEVNFNASSLASGVYIYKIQAGTFINSKKMILLK